MLFGTIDTFLIWRLTNKKHHFTDATNASRNMIYKLNSNKWDDEILKKLNINGSIDRCLWNLYFPWDYGEFHQDTPDKHYFSAIYPLHTTDGLTIIKDQSFTDSEGFAKVFPSNLMHKGVGPSKSPFRMNLNLVFKLDS